MSPRRSSRARTTQPTSSAPATHSGSSSSTSSRHTERAARTIHKQSSPQKSSTPHSLSSEEVDDAHRGSQVERPQTRRRTREQDNDEDDSTKLEEDLEDEIAEEEEITRCLCGQQEYPGAPSDGGKSRDGQSSSLTDSDVQNDEAGGLFIQCDICKVWQHGGCVGIMDEAASPDEYFCEECRKDLHKLMTSSKGQKYSRYLPVYEQNHSKTSRKTSLSKEPESKAPKDKDRNNRASVESLGKRRSTMNSRAAYDEDEVLRKVLEESKNEGTSTLSENGNRKKRGRDESEEIKQESKRQRTSSRSPSNSPVLWSDEEIPKATAPKQKPRGAAAKSQREKELREKERERERAEAANRRKGRAERRKGDDPDTVEVEPAEDPSMAPSASESVAPDTSSTDLKPAPVQRKSGRPPQKRQSRLGRNQYTRDAPTPATNGASPAANDTPNSPQISVTNGVGNGHESSDGAAGNKPGKSKNWRLEKLSWNEIRRPAGHMQNYITQRQVELAAEKPPSALSVQSPTAVNGEQKQEGPKDNEDDIEHFRKLNTLQMMDDLSRELVHWQRMIAEQTEK
ncbi:uncharacterized protein BDR25DRAFT_49812 [Lindgomyces ingoldianus]|uniref:Uncharacterized protein n=1 Tax=Lindgomyces ingoldianus TaxID=673940 RepID=A0ACB6QR49_9PLEO|nr:uncharacterized protein BDR25DRAFT_49812 [Lindgomyces ingoldianus]KAF2469468.1 hypothetical protein BDR25DRAFT_49812 [Lindgomyces ingoldianus]